MATSKKKTARIFKNLASMLVLTAILTGIGWYATLAIVDTGSFNLFLFLLSALVFIEMFNIYDILTSHDIGKESLTFATMFLNASMLAHIACATIFICYLAEMDALDENMLVKVRALQSMDPDTPPTMLHILLFFPFVRFVAQCWFTVQLMLQKRYCWF